MQTIGRIRGQYFQFEVMTTVILTLLLLTLPALSFSFDQTKVDSLRKVLFKASDDQQGALYLELSKTYGIDSPTQAYKAARQATKVGKANDQHQITAQGFLLLAQWSRSVACKANATSLLLDSCLQLSLEHKDQELQLLALMQMSKTAWSHYDRPSFDSLEVKISRLSSAVTEDSEILGKITLSEAQTAYHDYETEKAEQYFNQALNYFKLADYPTGMISVHLDLAVLNLRLRQHAESAMHFERAEITAESHQHSYWLMKVLMRKAMFLTFNEGFATREELETTLDRIDALAKTCKNDYGLMKYNYFKSRRLRDLGAGDAAVPYAEEYLRLSKSLCNHANTIQAALFLSTEYHRQGHIEKALALLLEVKDLAFRVDFRVERLLSLISRYYRNSGEPKKALKTRQQSVAYEKNRSKTLPYYFYYNYYSDYSNIYMDLDSLGLATIYQDSALQIAREKGTINEVLNVLMGQVHVSIRHGNYKKGEEEFEEAQRVIASMTVESTGIELAEFHSLGALLYFSKADYKTSIEYAHKTIAANKSLRRRAILADNYEILSKAHEALGQFEEAHRYLKAYTSVKDSTFNVQANSKLLTLKEQYESEQKQLKIDVLTRDKALNELRLTSNEHLLQRSRIIQWMLIGTVVVLLVIAWLVFNRFKLRRKAKELEFKNWQYVLEQKSLKAVRQAEMAELRSSLMANVSHEIRTPLTLIKGPLEDWKHDPTGITPEVVETMDQHADRLLMLVNEALDMSKARMESPSLQLKVVDVSQFFGKQLDAFRAKAEKQGVTLGLIDETDHALIAFDAFRMERVVANLVSNALRYTPNGGSILLKLERQEKQFQFQFSDSGSGIEAHHLPHLFDRHYRADEDLTSGHGLGLSIVKEIIEQHSGTIAVDSIVGRGTTFTIALPSMEAEQQLPVLTKVDCETESISSDEPDDRPMVLVVEDNQDVRNYVTQALSEDYNVITAEDGREGEVLARRKVPDLIVSDVAMPRKDGFELTRSLKSEFLTSHIPIVLLTAKATQEDKLNGLEAGADYYLPKPFSPMELRLCLRNLLKQQERMRQHFDGTLSAKPTPETTRTAIDQEFLSKALTVVEENLDNQALNIEQFCSEMALNRTSVHLKLKALTGKNTTGFIKSVRIRKATELIRTSSLPLAEIGDLTGFNNRQSFNRAFKEQLRMSPSEYRDRMKLVGVKNDQHPSLNGSSFSEHF